MSPFLDTLRTLGPLRLAVMAGVSAALLAFFIYLTSRLAGPDFALLYGELDQQDSVQIVSRLDQLGVSYRLDSDAGRIHVPSQEVARLRLAMAEDGLPSGGSFGYEIFDRSEGLGTTNFVQNINHLRALEGELSRTIRSIAHVKQARVHLVLPRRELFSRDRQEPSASIIVTMSGSRRLDNQQVAAVQHLVAAAVPGLKPDMISIVDNKGTLLARGASGDDPRASASTIEEMRSTYEARLARTIEELLERSVGLGNVRAEVSADMDFSRITENAETYDPDGQVVRSTQVVEEANDSRDGEGPPPVTVGNNLPDADLPALGGGAGSESNSLRTEETVNYEISRTVKTTVREAGLIRRLSVAVLVNGELVEGADGQGAYQPRSAEEMEQLAALVRSAVGYDESRGDTVELVNLRFTDLEAEAAPPSPLDAFGFTQADMMRVAELVVLGIVAVLVMLLVVRPLITRVMEGSPEAMAQAGVGPGMLPDPTGAQPLLTGPAATAGGMAITNQTGKPGEPGSLPAGVDEDLTAAEIEKMIDLNKVEGRVRASSIKKIGEIIEKHPEEAAGILRNWLYQET